MSAFIHTIFGLLLGLILWRFTGGRFSLIHVAVLGLCSWVLGPDAVQPVQFYSKPLRDLLHDLPGFFVTALVLSLIFHLFLRYRWSAEGFKLEKRDEKDIIGYLNIYLVISAAGILHNFFDGTFDSRIISEFVFSTGYSTPGVNQYYPEMLGMAAFTVVFVLSLPLAMRYGARWTVAHLLGFSALYFLLLLAYGYRLVGGETDLGLTVVAVFYLVIPLFLLYLSALRVAERVKLWGVVIV